MKNNQVWSLLLAAATTLSSAMAAAQAYPAKPIKVVVSFAAGGGADFLGRTIAAELASQFGQSVVVENRGGASGTLGTNYVAKSTPDGYTLLFSAGGSLTISPHFAQLPYDPLKDLAPVSLVNTNSGVLVVSPSFPASNVREFLDVLKKSPGKYAYASSGAGGPTHLAGELIKSTAGIDMIHIPYKGDGPAITDVMAGTTPIMVTVFVSVTPQMRAGRLKPIAALGTTRSPQFPDLPTFAESGFPGFSVATWNGLLAPGGTPADIVQKLNGATRTALAKPDVREKLTSQGTVPTSSTPAEFAALIRDDLNKWATVVRTANIKVDIN